MGVSDAVWQTEGMTFGPVSAGFSLHLARVLVFLFFFFSLIRPPRGDPALLHIH